MDPTAINREGTAGGSDSSRRPRRCPRLVTVLAVAGMGLGVIGVPCGCAGSGAARRHAEVTSDERGVAELSELQRNFREALRQGDLSEAEALLETMQDQIERADATTRAHPDFEDLQGSVGRAQTHLEVAGVKDALDESREALTEASRLLQSLASRAPSAEDIEALGDALSRARDGRERIAEAEVDPQVRSDLTERLSQAIAQLERAHEQASWVYETGDGLDRLVAEALEAEKRADPSSPDDTRLAAHRDAAEAFGACVQAAERAQAAGGYRAELKVQTGLGRMRIDELALTCGFRQVSAQSAHDKLRWREEVTELARLADAAVGRLEVSSDAASRLDAVEEASSAYGTCHEGLATLKKDPRRDSRARFETRLGVVTVEELYKACRREHARTLQEQTGQTAAAQGEPHPTPGAQEPSGPPWKRVVGEVRDRIRRARKQVRRTKRQRAPRKKVDLLNNALEGYEACLERTSELAEELGQGAPRGSGARNRRATLRSLTRTCRKGYKSVKRKLRRLRSSAITSKPAKRRGAVRLSLRPRGE